MNLVRWFVDSIHKKVCIVYSLGIYVVLMTQANFTLFKIAKIELCYYLYSLLFLLFFMWWYFQFFSIKRNNSDAIGILFLTKESINVKDVSAIKETLFDCFSSRIGESFYLQVVDSTISKKLRAMAIHDSKKLSTLLIRKNFVFVFLMTEHGKNREDKFSYVLSVEYFHQNSMIDDDTFSIIKSDIVKVFQKEIVLSDNKDVDYAIEEVNKFNIKINYFAALVSLVSWDFISGITFLLKCEEYFLGIGEYSKLGKAEKYIYDILPRRVMLTLKLANLLIYGNPKFHKQMEYVDKYKEAIGLVDDYFNKYIRKHNDHQVQITLGYNLLLDHAIICYLTDDIIMAKSYLIKAKELLPKDVNWKLSMAFLCIIEKDYDQALSFYRTSYDIGNRKVLEIRDFIYSEIDRSSRADLYLGTGLINHFYKIDSELAKRDFQAFLIFCKNTLIDKSQIATYVERLIRVHYTPSLET